MNDTPRQDETVRIERLCDVCGNKFFDSVPFRSVQVTPWLGRCEDCAEAEEQSANDYTEESNEQT